MTKKLGQLCSRLQCLLEFRHIPRRTVYDQHTITECMRCGKTTVSENDLVDQYAAEGFVVIDVLKEVWADSADNRDGEAFEHYVSRRKYGEAALER